MRVLICDDHSLFAEALAVVLTARGHTVVATVATPDAAAAVAATSRVDLCVMDLQFPGASGVAGIGSVLRESPSTRIVALTGLTDSMLLSQAISAGARGLATKGDGIDRVVNTIRRVHEGEIVLVPEGLHFATKGQGDRMDRHANTRFLTVREREVLQRLVDGQSTADLVRDMGVRYTTARTHIQNLLMKLGVHSKLEAVAFAVANQMVTIAGVPGATIPTGVAGKSAANNGDRSEHSVASQIN